MEVRRLGPDDLDAVMAASPLFDGPARLDATRRFLIEPGHHLLLATVDGATAGFVSGVETTHPDKGTEMFLYELGVDPVFQRQGIGRALVDALGALARERGCYGMWVLPEPGNEAALSTYRRAGATEEETCVLLNWTFGPA